MDDLQKAGEGRARDVSVRDVQDLSWRVFGDQIGEIRRVVGEVERGDPKLEPSNLSPKSAARSIPRSKLPHTNHNHVLAEE
jgi:hypothetical protein